MELIDKLIIGTGAAIVGVSLGTLGLLVKMGVIHLPEIKKEEQAIETNLENEEKEQTLDDKVKLNPQANIAYEKYINLIVNEIKLAGLDNNIGQIFAAYSYLQENGYISLGEDFSHTKEVNVDEYSGITVAVGEGESSDLLTVLMDVLKGLDYDVNIISGELYQKGEKTGEVNHVLCYIKEGGHYFLLDPDNLTIFFKNGNEYISMNDENLRFLPDITYDIKEENFKDNKDIYFSLENCYKDCDWFMQEYPYREEEAANQDEFFKEYEMNNIFSLEQEIEAYLKEYEEELNNKNAKKIHLELTK